MMQEFLLVRSVVCVAYMFSHIFSSSVLGFFLFFAQCLALVSGSCSL